MCRPVTQSSRLLVAAKLLQMPRSRCRADQVAEAELDLLIELASGKKTFDQVRSDALKFAFAGEGLQRLVHSNASRGITQRLKQLTGIDKESLSYFEVRCKEDCDGSKSRMHPFSLLSTRIQTIQAQDEEYFNIVREPVSNRNVVASSFTNSPEYLTHELVSSPVVDLAVVPVGLYSDGIKICDDTHPDSLYVVYLYFLHRPADETARPLSKHLYTAYRKSDSSAETLEDIWKVLLWELKALASGFLPLRGEERKPLASQCFGPLVTGRHCFCLMQVKGDWSWYVEALGLWQWNSKSHMCPYCRASRDGPLSWHNFSLEAPWLATCRDHSRYLEDMELSKRADFCRDASPFAFEPLLCQAPFFKWTMVKLDWQHAQDLGALSYEIGEAWWSLLPGLARLATAGTKQDRGTGLQELKRRLKQYYADKRVDSRIPLKRLGLRKIKARKHPKLKAKAVQTKRLLPFTLALAAELRHTDGALGEHRYQSLGYASKICSLASQREITSDELMSWRAWQALHMFHYASCGFRVYPKFHYALHLPAQVERSGVPRTFWVYSDEGKNSEIRRVFNVCSKGHAVYQQILLRLDWLFALKALRAAL